MVRLAGGVLQADVRFCWEPITPWHLPIRSKPIAHGHDPPDPPDDNTPSSPSVSRLTTPTATTPSLDNCPSQTPLNATMDSLEALDSRTPTLTELLYPYLTLKPEPPKFPKLEEENEYLRQRVVELNCMNEALTKRLIHVNIILRSMSAWFLPFQVYVLFKRYNFIIIH